MKLSPFLVVAIFGAALALPSASSAASTPTQDSVTLFGGPATVSTVNDFVIYGLAATSGPSGENATGHVTMDATIIATNPFTYHLDGAVTCLAVNGNQASINFTDPNHPEFGAIRVQVVDGQPDTFTSTPSFGNFSASDCTPTSVPPNGQVVNGDIKVVDDGQPQPPIVTFVRPTEDSTEVPPTGLIIVAFDQAMDKPSAEAAFSLKRTSDGAPVSGQFGWYGPGVLLFKPSPDLDPGTQYTASVSTGAKDLAGNPLAAPFSWSYTTGGSG